MTPTAPESIRSRPGRSRAVGRLRLRQSLLVVGMLLHLFPAMAANFSGVQVVAENGYAGCLELRNDSTRVVLEPTLGGRVSHYQFRGVEVLHQDAAFDNATLASLGRPGQVPGGRFDFGPEFLQPPHLVLWAGTWRAEITGDRSARMTSEVDPATGLQLVRDFRLDAVTSRLTCTQTIIDRDTTVCEVCYWGRTFGEGGGICVVPLNPASRYPVGYLTYGPDAVINFKPSPEPNVIVQDGLMAIVGPTAQKKFAIDVSEGWLAYLTRGDVLFIKRFTVYSNRRYGEIAGNAVSVWNDGDRKCELEPIGPLEELTPGGQAEFTEEWSLHPFTFPLDRQVDFAAIREKVASIATPMLKP